MADLRRPFFEQPDTNKKRFVQPRALSIIAHKGIEFVIWRKGNGSLTPAPVIAKPATAGDYWQSPGRS